jgi:hypothetical protein
MGIIKKKLNTSIPQTTSSTTLASAKSHAAEPADVLDLLMGASIPKEKPKPTSTSKKRQAGKQFPNLAVASDEQRRSLPRFITSIRKLY